MRATSRSLERLTRSAFELDIPDMRTTREERERSRREMHLLNEKLADQVEGVSLCSIFCFTYELLASVRSQEG